MHHLSLCYISNYAVPLEESNLEHAAKHGVTPEECEAVASRARPPYPQAQGNRKWLVHGRGAGDRFVQIVYIVDPDDTFYVIHARPMTETEKRDTEGEFDETTDSKTWE